MNKLEKSISRRDRSDLMHRLELPRLGHRQSREPRRGVPAQLPSGLRVGEGRRACDEGYYYPLVHCGTSFGNYKEVRGYLLQSSELRERVRKILGKLGRLVDGKLLIPEEVVHYSEWLHVMRDRDRQASGRSTAAHIRATIHPACHVYKMVPEDAIYDDTVLDGNRVAVSTGLMQALGANVIDYSTWYDCCGFGFRHIISEREFTRSFAIDRKIRVAQEEAHADVMIGHDTGCITTLDKSQWIGKAAGKECRPAGAGRRASSRPWCAARIPTRSCSRTGMHLQPKS